MVTTCWSVKGGSGTTVVAASLALLGARAADGATLLDLAGDLPAVLGMAEPAGPGVAEWLATELRSPASLARLAVPVRAGLALVPRGQAALPGEEASATDAMGALALAGGAWVVDAGVPTSGIAAAAVRSATASLLVLRPCYLAVRRAAARELPATGVVLVRERGRALSARDVEDVLGLPVLAEVEVDPAVARAVDAGLLASRLPRVLERGLRGAA